MVVASFVSFYRVTLAAIMVTLSKVAVGAGSEVACANLTESAVRWLAAHAHVRDGRCGIRSIGEAGSAGRATGFGLAKVILRRIIHNQS